MTLPKAIAAALLVASLGVGGLAVAGPETVADTTGLRLVAAQEESAQPGAPAGPTTEAMSIQQVIDRLAEQGYSNVREVERERGRYEVKAQGQDGRRYELYVDAKTGEIVKREGDD